MVNLSPTAPVSDPYENFNEEVKAFKASGGGIGSATGWALYVIGFSDALINILNGGSLTSLVWSLIFGSAPVSLGKTLLVVAIQLFILLMSAFALSTSPWRKWLISTLIEHSPKAVIRKIQGHRSHRTISGSNITQLYIMLIGQCAVYVIAMAVSIYAIHVANTPSMVVKATILVSSFGFSYLCAHIFPAIVVSAWSDAASTAGLLTGAGVTAIGLVYARPITSVIVQGYPAYFEFHAFEMLVLAISVITFSIIQRGSIKEAGKIYLTLDSQSTGVFRHLPDATGSAYRSFAFEVQTNGLTILLLSRPIMNARSFQIHTTLDQQDLRTARWAVLNLSELEREVRAAAISCQIVRGHLECNITANFNVRSTESFLGRFRAGEPFRLPIEDVEPFQQSSFAQYRLRDLTISTMEQTAQDVLERLPSSLQPNSATDAVILNSLLSRIRVLAAQVKNALSIQAAAFKANASMGLRVDRDAEVNEGLQGALRAVPPVLDEFNTEYARLSEMNENFIPAAASMQVELERELRAALDQLTTVPNGSASSIIRITHFIEVGFRAQIGLTKEAQDFRIQLHEIHADVNAKVDAVINDMADAAGQYGADARKRFEAAMMARLSKRQTDQMFAAASRGQERVAGSDGGPQIRSVQSGRPQFASGSADGRLKIVRRTEGRPTSGSSPGRAKSPFDD